MPLYEYFCDHCATSFEALVLSGASKQAVFPCPECSEPSRRILSSVNFAAGRRAPPSRHDRDPDGKPDVTNLQLPPAARLCWMDDRSAARLAAYKAGRGAEYDDTTASRKELASQRGETGSKPGTAEQSHSPLSNPVVLAHRREAAQKQKIAESAKIVEGRSLKPE
jgi:putative FmdB family regulatory protein